MSDNYNLDNINLDVVDRFVLSTPTTDEKLDQLIKEQRLTNQMLMYLACIMIGVPDAKTMVKTKLAAFTAYMEAEQ